MTARTKNTDITEADLAAEKMGRNKLQGDDQANVRNQRHAVPHMRHETDGIIESLEKLDKHVRARRDLGKVRENDRDDDKGKASADE